MASKLGGAEPVRGSSGPRASRAKATLENGLHVNGNSQSNRSRSNPTALSPRHPGAERGVGGVLGTPPTYAPLLRGGEPALATRWNDVEPRTPWLRSAPHVGGDRRTTGRLHAINCLADSASVVVASTFKGPVCARGGSNSVFSTRVRASAAVRQDSTVAIDDLAGSHGRRTRRHDFRKEGRGILSGGGAESIRARPACVRYANPTDATISRATAIADRSHRGLAGISARSEGERKARIGHQAVAFRSIANSVSVVSSGNALLISGHAWRGNLLRCFQTRTLPTLAEIRWANSATPTAAITDAGVEFMPHTLHGVMRSASTSLHAITRRAVIFPHGR